MLSDVIAEKVDAAGNSTVEILTTFMRWLSNPKLGYNVSMDGWIKLGCLHLMAYMGSSYPGISLNTFRKFVEEADGSCWIRCL